MVSALVGFCGFRRLPPAWGPLVSSVVSSVVAGGRQVAVGCAPGADALVRSAPAFPAGAVVFRASSFGRGRGAFAARSVALVRAVAASGPGRGLVSFPGRACPASVIPSAASGSCFSGAGSGSWASCAFAAGLGVPVVVFLPASVVVPPWPGGVWSPAAAGGVWSSGWLWVPA